MLIGQVSKLLSIPISTIRYYERVGLLEPPARVSGRRHFSGNAITFLKFIRLAQSAGFTISEMKKLRDDFVQDPCPSSMWSSPPWDHSQAPIV